MVLSSITKTHPTIFHTIPIGIRGLLEIRGGAYSWVRVCINVATSLSSRSMGNKDKKNKEKKKPKKDKKKVNPNTPV